VELLDDVRHDRPRVHCITNTVAMNYTANILLAVGAIPSMSIDPSEISDFVSSADALLINLGTLSTERKDSITKAIETANNNHRPWVLDPVFVNRSPQRLKFAREIAKRRPVVIRANADEIRAMADHGTATGEFAHKMNTVIGQTGQPDIVTDGNVETRISNGHALMSRVTALGCATSALTAAFTAVTNNTRAAAVSALLVIGIAGEIAVEFASGPGSLQTGILDALYNLNNDQITQRSRIE